MRRRHPLANEAEDAVQRGRRGPALLPRHLLHAALVLLGSAGGRLDARGRGEARRSLVALVLAVDALHPARKCHLPHGDALEQRRRRPPQQRRRRGAEEEGRSHPRGRGVRAGLGDHTVAGGAVAPSGDAVEQRAHQHRRHAVPVLRHRLPRRRRPARRRCSRRRRALIRRPLRHALPLLWGGRLRRAAHLWRLARIRTAGPTK
mmetsp:Transcript_28329/g.92342  ORF Transcript_28329/g.92342 Transcript_28329/m.92342 type:complete len:204 (+) Transcript_28329:407-1018(+)